MSISVFYANIDTLTDPENFDMGFRMLPQFRQEQVMRYRAEQSRRQSMGAWLVLKQALRDMGIPEDQPEIAFTRYGKPYLAEYPDIHFNLSHAGSRVLCAVSDRPIGCDVEEIKEFRLKVAERAFSPSEYALIAQVQEGQRELFYQIWTRKEAVMKQVGGGFTMESRDFSVYPKVEREKLKAAAADMEQAYVAEEFHFQEMTRGNCRFCVVAEEEKFEGFGEIELPL